MTLESATGVNKELTDGISAIDIRSTNSNNRKTPSTSSAIVNVTPFPVTALREELILRIFSHIDREALGRVAHMNKALQRIASDESLWKAIFYKELVFFGEKEWKEHFGDPGVVSAPTGGYKAAVKREITWQRQWPKEWDRKTVWWDAKDVLPLGATERVPTTSKKIGRLVAPKLGAECDPTGYEYFKTPALQQYGDTRPQESRWKSMTPDVIPGSRCKSYPKQMQRASQFGGEVPQHDEAVRYIFLKAVSSKKRVFSDDPWWTFTHCQESRSGYQLVVGGFTSRGLEVSHYIGDGYNFGVAALRKF